MIKIFVDILFRLLYQICMRNLLINKNSIPQKGANFYLYIENVTRWKKHSTLRMTCTLYIQVDHPPLKVA